ncbi:MAG: C1 family peptidase [Saprospiraceae bacterium]
MPVRMEKDPQRPNRGGGGSGGGMGGLIQILPFILMFLIRRPKLLIPLLLIGAAWYFFFGGQQMLSGGGANYDNYDVENDPFSMGAALSEERFDQAQVFEPLTYGAGENRLPERVTLEKYAPQRLHQGNQGSCVGWASAYAARTILQARASGQNPNQLSFSPSYLYNQIRLSGCEGAYMLDAMKAMSQNGAMPFQQFGYDDSDCSRVPNSQEMERGRQYRIKGYNRLTVGADDHTPDILAIKQNLAQGAPVVVGMMVGGSFMSGMLGKEVWRPTQSDYSMRGYGGHAMCVIGYDDNKDGGAFQLMNSWSEDWGNRGLAWVRYRDFEHFTKEAYGLYPMGSADQQNADKMQVKFGLLDQASQSLLTLTQKDEMTFKTVKPLKKGDKFKVAITNSIECYTYVFGQETDGTSYVLFPYTEQHSPYCGIVGTRVFPKDYSMVLDQTGNKDYIAILVSKKELDYQSLNKAITASRQQGYANKVREALGNRRITNIKFQTGNAVEFNATTDGKEAVAMVIEIDKN